MMTISSLPSSSVYRLPRLFLSNLGLQDSQRGSLRLSLKRHAVMGAAGVFDFSDDATACLRQLNRVFFGNNHFGVAVIVCIVVSLLFLALVPLFVLS